MKRRLTRKSVTATLLVAAMVTALSLSIEGLAVPKAGEMTDVISYPLPSLPEPLLLGGDLRVDVKAGSDTTGWEASISSRFGSANLEYLNASHGEEGWTVYFSVPSDLTPELYDLTVRYQEEGEDVEYTHPKCVWLLAEWPDELTISHISDLHLQHGRDPIAKYIHEVNMFDPDLIIATGDIVQTETVAAGWDYLRHEMEWIDVPLFLLPGNHDHAGGGSLIYQRYCGPLNYSVVLGDFLFIALDSHLEDEEWSNQFRWVESVLEEHPDKVKIMAWHHPLLGYEIEDVEGTPIGHNITGTWEDLEQFKRIGYYGWMWGPDLLKDAFSDLLRVIQVYDVRVILSGHIHYDVIHLLNNRHYFINVGPVGGGLPPGQYHGSRLMTIDSEGNLELDGYAASDIFAFANSIPVDGLSYWYSSENDWSESAVSATIVNGLELDLPRARLEFHVSSEHQIGEYRWSVEPVEYEAYTTDDGHIFVAYFDVPSGAELDVALSAVDDDVLPEVHVEVSGYTAGEPVKGTVTVSDAGWGVDSYSVSYVNDVMATWDSLDASFSPTINGDVYDITWPEFSYSFTVPAEQALPGLMVRVEAVDHAGNTVTYVTEDLTQSPRYTLSVDSEPSGIEVTVDGEAVVTPFSDELEAGSYVVTVPEEASVSGTDYEFSGWEDGGSGSTRTVDLDGDTSLIAEYEEAAAGPAGIPLPTPYVLVGLLLAVGLIHLLSRR